MAHNAGPLQAKELNRTQSDSSCDICYSLVEQCHPKTIKYMFSLLNGCIHAQIEKTNSSRNLTCVHGHQINGYSRYKCRKQLRQ